MNRLLVIVTALALLAGCATRPEASPELRQQLGTLRERVYTYVAMERSRSGETAKDLVVDLELTEAAQAHSEEMATRRAFDVAGTGGDNLPMRRLTANQAFQGLVGENIAMGSISRRSWAWIRTWWRGPLWTFG